eukprot:TRINITY_DN8796_c0_g1_i1.p2 TRINITY_DN8796_c0_g1~~TRINITY_DN8796_c0_g1_i1.p2  ORF type:complete len:128 (+),score=47.39 TRINITY_DN8796_c0_g1_i1:70-453(+)
MKAASAVAAALYLAGADASSVATAKFLSPDGPAPTSLHADCSPGSADENDSKSVCCKEPDSEEYKTYSGGVGPEKIKCCWKAKQVYAELEQRCTVDCNDNHPCNKSLKDACPGYLEKYKGMMDDVCN